VRVLELGCGTGRYFHWLNNTDLLVGTDISSEMLRHAKHPLQAADVTAREIRLIHGNLYDIHFTPGSFDFIYSLGVFGHGAELTATLCDKLMSWLAPGGRLYLDALHQLDPGRYIRIKKSAKAAVLPFMPKSVRDRVHERKKSTVPTFNHTRAQLEQLMVGAGFEDFMISTNTCQSPLWSGLHTECLARKTSDHRKTTPAQTSAATTALV
jgi:cyclopropane fatty-acyl-phospholipid synthase-like methyltransferase